MNATELMVQICKRINPNSVSPLNSQGDYLTVTPEELQAFYEAVKQEDCADGQCPFCSSSQNRSDQEEKIKSLNLRVARLTHALQAMVNSAAENNCGLKIADDALFAENDNQWLKEMQDEAVRKYQFHLVSNYALETLRLKLT
jgi:hypothetical protein